MIHCEPGDVLLVRFPFTDLTSTKKRPVVVVNSLEYSARYGDWVVLALTSSAYEDDFALEDWQKAGLIRPSGVKPLIATLAPDVFDKRLGALSERDRNRVGGILRRILAREFLSV